jgi:hypothetical protein
LTTTEIAACEHIESMNPRKQGWCEKCGREMPKPDEFRDLEYEQRFLAEAERIAERRFGIPTSGFQSSVSRRLEMGQKLYGNAFLEKDLAVEAIEEAWDSGAYAVLEAQKRMAAGVEDDAMAWHVFEIACHAAAIHHHARQLWRNEQ